MAGLGNFASRVVVSVVAVPILVFIIYQESALPVWGLAFGASLIAMYEFFAMTHDDRTDIIVSTLLGGGAVLAFYWLPQSYSATATFLAVFFPVFLYFLFRFGDIETVASRACFSVIGILYAGIFFTFMALIKRDFGPHGADFIILLLGTAWLSDTGGYFAGKALGKRKLYAAISPNKTWAGAIGGTIAAGCGAILIRMYLLPEFSWFDILFLAASGSVLGQAGDLCESMIKRSRGVKDSGAILPGHGGILDRVDAVLFIAPYFYLYITVRGLVA